MIKITSKFLRDLQNQLANTDTEMAIRFNVSAATWGRWCNHTHRAKLMQQKHEMAVRRLAMEMGIDQ